MGKYRKLAEDIVENVGGIENISSVTHCITRLRFHLKDEGKAKDDVLKAMDGVVTVMHSAGQYQVVIGNHVPYVYEDVCEVCGIGNEIKEKEAAGEEAPKGAFNKLIDIVSGCFQPILGPLCASGIIRGLNALLVFLPAPANVRAQSRFSRRLQEKYPGQASHWEIHIQRSACQNNGLHRDVLIW